MPSNWVIIVGGSGLLKGGTPLWAGADAEPVMPASSTSAHNVFMGVTVRHNEDATGPVRLVKAVEFLVRVRGPVSVGDAIAQAAGQDFLVSTAEADSDAPTAGIALGDVGDAEVRLIRAQLTGGGGGGGGEALWA